MKSGEFQSYQLIKTCIQYLGYDAWELGGGGDCFFHSISPSVGIPASDLRHRVAQQVRANEEIYGGHGE